jgi:phosphoribosylglycinamide formyltransferase 1
MASGKGSNFDAIQNAIENKKLNATINIVISDQKDAKVLISAKKKNIPTKLILKKDFETKDKYELEISNTISIHNAELIVLAGYMKLLGESFIKRHSGKIINIHPALLPDFPGLNVQQKALESGAKESGCTIHYVDEGMDTGPIITKKTVPITKDDTVETLSLRILKAEHDTYWRVIKQIANKS